MRFRNNPEWVGVVTEEVDILVYWLNSDLQVGGRKKIELALFSWAALPSAA